MSNSPIFFAALALTAIALIPSGAHVFEMHAKLSLDRESYFTVQSIYRGWALFGFVILAALAACIAAAILSPAANIRASCAFAAAMIIVSLVIFFSFVYPANVATSSWTIVPPDWEKLRSQWEWGHAASALCTFLGFLALAWAASSWKE